ncbi:MAG: FecR family protein [Mangrovibacterium sp.]
MKVDPHIIKRYLDGTGEKGDEEKIGYWFSNSGEEAELREAYNRYWNELPDTMETEGYDEAKMLGEIYHQIKIDESKSSKEPVKRNITQRIITILTRIAAVLFIPLTIFVLLNKERFTSTETGVAYSEIYAPMGTRTKFYLPDGSYGYLNAGSSIKFPTVFKEKSRDISLNGEAFFDVRSNPEKPFIVSGENIKVIAYGTSFNVEAYSEDQINRITLVHGKVEVFGKKNDEVRNLGILNPGEMCVFNEKESSYKFVQVNANNIVSWKDGRLVFINEPFNEVIKKLNRKYSVNMIIKDKKLNDYSYKATFEDETLDEALNLLKLSAPIEIKELQREKRPDGSFGEKTIEFYFRN